MNNVSQVDFKQQRCAVCKINSVTHYCDFVIKYVQNTYFVRNRQLWNKINQYGAQNMTCDLPMCENCASQQDGDMHLCPHHQKLMCEADLPNDYQRNRAQIERVRALTQKEQ